tara:strand:- start:174 stop:530 length:357 start_codon:yes stop_codon:yes gene_type:complete
MFVVSNSILCNKGVATLLLPVETESLSVAFFAEVAVLGLRIHLLLPTAFHAPTLPLPVETESLPTAVHAITPPASRVHTSSSPTFSPAAYDHFAKARAERNDVGRTEARVETWMIPIG